ncbi:MAG: cytochrome C oxidase subunit IV family protein [Acidobacteriota bacterium]
MAPSYKSYWIAWSILLAITVVMVSIATPAVLLAGIAVKASIIALWFMHLRHERLALTATVIAASLLTCLLLFGLIATDGLAS